jgi:hypothetical protein
VSGHFDRSRIYKSATEVGATLSDYRGIEVAEIQPFGREEERFKEVRWLAVLDSSVLVFGSVSLTRLELDRFLGRAHADESIVRRLGRLRSKDQTWCVLSGSIRSLSSPVWTEEIRKSLADVSPELATKALSADEFEFGLFYGRKVEFEYFLSRASTEPDKSNADPSKQSSLQPVRSTALLPALNTTGPANALHDVIAIPVPRFEEWLAKISTSSH